MGRTVLCILILLLMAGSIFFMLPETVLPTAENVYQPLFQIMEKADASITGGEIYYWASLPQKESHEHFTLQELETLADELVAKLTGFVPGEQGGSTKAGDKSLAVVSYSECGEALSGEGEYLLVQREGQLYSGEEMKLLLQLLDQEGREAVYLLLIVSGEEPRRLAELASRIPSLLDAGMTGSTLSFSLAGDIDREMKPDEMEELAFFLIREIGGTEGQGMSEGHIVSVTGYFPGLGNYFQAGKDRLNLNIALRCDDLTGNTFIWAGTPLISSWY